MADLVDKEILEDIRDQLQDIVDTVNAAILAVDKNNINVAIESIFSLRKLLFSKSVFLYRSRVELYMKLSLFLELISAYKYSYLRESRNIEDLHKQLKSLQLDEAVRAIKQSGDINFEQNTILNSDDSNSSVDNIIEQIELDDITSELLRSLEDVANLEESENNETF